MEETEVAPLISNRTYDILFIVVTVAAPGLATLVLTLASTWGWAFGPEIAATITALAFFLGVLLKTSKTRYAKSVERFTELALADDVHTVVDDSTATFDDNYEEFANDPKSTPRVGYPTKSDETVDG